MENVEMPDNPAARLLMFIRQNDGTLGKMRRAGEWKQLTTAEVAAIEAIVKTTFAGFVGRPHVP